ncbi:uncharacterized protein LOC122542364 [Chiloscyllium plagiosum]|nr:uncharacterized protein LOC122542364 [Chiloscyllium plagiosum]
MNMNEEEEDGGMAVEDEKREELSTVKEKEKGAHEMEEDLDSKVENKLKNKIEDEIMRRLEEELVKLKLEEKMKQNLEEEIKVKLEEEKLKMTEEMKRKLEEEMKYEIEKEIKRKLEDEKSRMEEELTRKIKQEMKYKIEEAIGKRNRMEEERLCRKLMERKERKRRKEEEQKKKGEERKRRDKQLQKEKEELMVYNLETEREAKEEKEKRKEHLGKAKEKDEAKCKVEEDLRKRTEGVRRALEKKNVKKNLEEARNVEQRVAKKEHKQEKMGEKIKDKRQMGIEGAQRADTKRLVEKEEQRVCPKAGGVEGGVQKSMIVKMEQLPKKSKAPRSDVKQIGSAACKVPGFPVSTSPPRSQLHGSFQPSSCMTDNILPTSVRPFATALCPPTPAMLTYTQKVPCPSQDSKRLHPCPFISEGKRQSLLRNELEAFYELFKLFSEPPSHNVIDIHNLCVGLRAMDIELTEAKLRELLALLDVNRDGQVCFEDFLEFVTDTDQFLRYFAQLPDSCDCSRSQKGLLTDTVFFRILAEILRLGELSVESTKHIVRYYFAKKKGAGIKDQREKKASGDVQAPSFMGMTLHRLVHYIDVLEPDDSYVESPLTQQQVAAFWEFYELFDKNNQGNIDTFSLLKIMNSLSIYMSNQLVPVPLQFLAVNEGRAVTFHDFLGILSDTGTFGQFLVQEQDANCQVWNAAEIFTTDALIFDAIEKSLQSPLLDARAAANIMNYYHQKFKGSLVRCQDHAGRSEDAAGVSVWDISREASAAYSGKLVPRASTGRKDVGGSVQGGQAQPQARRSEAFQKRFQKALQNPNFNTVFSQYSWTWKMEEAERNKRLEQIKKGKGKISTMK